MAKGKERPLKVCCTCRYWSPKHKGLCTRLNQGAGRFWICREWSEADPAAHDLNPPLLKEAAAGRR